MKVIKLKPCKCPMHMCTWTLKLVRITVNILRISTPSSNILGKRHHVRNRKEATTMPRLVFFQRGKVLELEVTDLELAEVLHLPSSSLLIGQRRGVWTLGWNRPALSSVLFAVRLDCRDGPVQLAGKKPPV